MQQSQSAQKIKNVIFNPAKLKKSDSMVFTLTHGAVEEIVISTTPNYRKDLSALCKIIRNTDLSAIPNNQQITNIFEKYEEPSTERHNLAAIMSAVFFLKYYQHSQDKPEFTQFKDKKINMDSAADFYFPKEQFLQTDSLSTAKFMIMKYCKSSTRQEYLNAHGATIKEKMVLGTLSPDVQQRQDSTNALIIKTDKKNIAIFLNNVNHKDIPTNHQPTPYFATATTPQFTQQPQISSSSSSSTTTPPVFPISGNQNFQSELAQKIAPLNKQKPISNPTTTPQNSAPSTLTQQQHSQPPQPKERPTLPSRTINPVSTTSTSTKIHSDHQPRFTTLPTSGQSTLTSYPVYTIVDQSILQPVPLMPPSTTGDDIKKKGLAAVYQQQPSQSTPISSSSAVDKQEAITTSIKTAVKIKNIEGLVTRYNDFCSTHETNLQTGGSKSRLSIAVFTESAALTGSPRDGIINFIIFLNKFDISIDIKHHLINSFSKYLAGDMTQQKLRKECEQLKNKDAGNNVDLTVYSILQMINTTDTNVPYGMSALFEKIFIRVSDNPVTNLHKMIAFAKLTEDYIPQEPFSQKTQPASEKPTFKHSAFFDKVQSAKILNQPIIDVTLTLKNVYI